MSIICEIGQNFCGDLNLAKKLILLAKENGADLAKFQLYDTDKLYTPDTELYRLAKESELPQEQAQMLFTYGESIGIEVFFSVFDVERVAWCEEIGVKRYKIAFSQRKNDELINAIPRHREIMVSSDFWEFDVTLYCVPKYPAEITDYELGWAFPVEYTRFDGLSDHTIGLDCAKIALARGASIIEKHFCIRHEVGVDAEWSMTPEELKELKRWENVVKEVL